MTSEESRKVEESAETRYTGRCRGCDIRPLDTQGLPRGAVGGGGDWGRGLSVEGTLVAQHLRRGGTCDC